MSESTDLTDKELRALDSAAREYWEKLLAQLELVRQHDGNDAKILERINLIVGAQRKLYDMAAALSPKE